MIRQLPEWWTEVKEEIEGAITDQANKLNIQYAFIDDSKCIENCIDGIMSTLERLKEEVKGEFNEEELKDFKKIKEVIEKEDREKGNQENNEESEEKSSNKFIKN